MRIYRVFADVNYYQSFLVDAPGWDAERFTFDGSPKAGTWVPPEVFVLHPLLKRGNFFDLCTGTLVFDARATEALRMMLEMSGELLPLFHKGENFTVLNVTECVNVLDEEHTEWEYGKTTGVPIWIVKYAFHAHRLTETPLFKIPETRKADILTCEGMKAPEDEFKPTVERLGLEGLLFEELWREDP